MGFFDLFSKQKAQLVFGASATIPIAEQELTIGRKENLNFDDNIVARKEGDRINTVNTTATRQVSRNHAQLTWDKRLKRYRIKDLSSKFGTTVKRHPLPAGTEVVLQNKDEVMLGKTIHFTILYS